MCTATLFARSYNFIAVGAAVYLLLFAIILLLERLVPQYEEWNRCDGQLVQDLSLTVVGRAGPGSTAGWLERTRRKEYAVSCRDRSSRPGGQACRATS